MLIYEELANYEEPQKFEEKSKRVFITFKDTTRL